MQRKPIHWQSDLHKFETCVGKLIELNGIRDSICGCYYSACGYRLPEKLVRTSFKDGTFVLCTSRPRDLMISENITVFIWTTYIPSIIDFALMSISKTGAVFSQIK